MFKKEFLILPIAIVLLISCKEDELLRKRGMKTSTPTGVTATDISTDNSTTDSTGKEQPSTGEKKKDKKQEALAKKYFFGFSYMPRGMFMPDESQPPTISENINKSTDDYMDTRLGGNFMRRQELYRLTPFSEQPFQAAFYFRTKKFRVDMIEMDEVTAGIVNGKIVEYERINQANLKNCIETAGGIKKCQWAAYPYKKTDAIDELIESVNSQERCYLANEQVLHKETLAGSFRTEDGDFIKKSKQSVVESHGEIICINHLGETCSFGEGISKSVVVTTQSKGEITTPNAKEDNDSILLMYERITRPDGALIYAHKHETVK